MAKKKSKKNLQDRTKVAQALFIKNYTKTRNISKACEAAEIDRSTYYDWMEKHSNFSAKCTAVIEKFDDLIEDGLFHYVKSKNLDALKFMAKMRLKKRDYSERTEVEHSGEVRSPVSITLVEKSVEEIKKLKKGVASDGKKSNKDD